MKLSLQRLSDMPNAFGSYAYAPVGDTANLTGLTQTAAGLRLYSPNKVGPAVLTTFEVEATETKRTIGGVERTFYNLPNPNKEQDMLVRESIHENMRIARLLNTNNKSGIDFEAKFKEDLSARLAGNVVLPTAKKQPISNTQAPAEVKAEAPAVVTPVVEETPAVTATPEVTTE